MSGKGIELNQRRTKLKPFFFRNLIHQAKNQNQNSEQNNALNFFTQTFGKNRLTKGAIDENGIELNWKKEKRYLLK